MFAFSKLHAKSYAFTCSCYTTLILFGRVSLQVTCRNPRGSNTGKVLFQTDQNTTKCGQSYIKNDHHWPSFEPLHTGSVTL